MSYGTGISVNELDSSSGVHSEEEKQLFYEVVIEVTLLSLYLTRCQEESKKHPGKKYNKAWKNHLFEVLDELQDRKCIHTFFNLKSVLLTDEGISKGEALMKRYFANHPSGTTLKYKR